MGLDACFLPQLLRRRSKLPVDSTSKRFHANHYWPEDPRYRRPTLAGLGAYRQQVWTEAAAAFRNCLELVPEDGPARVFLDRILLLSAQSLPANWAVVWILAE
jgi:hypothetical protein